MPDADPSTRTDPLLLDTDSDGLHDGLEDLNFNGRVDPGETDPTLFDSDGDGIPDIFEVDSDKDGLSNGFEELSAWRYV